MSNLPFSPYLNHFDYYFNDDLLSSDHKDIYREIESTNNRLNELKSCMNDTLQNINGEINELNRNLKGNNISSVNSTNLKAVTNIDVVKNTFYEIKIPNVEYTFIKVFCDDIEVPLCENNGFLYKKCRDNLMIKTGKESIGYQFNSTAVSKKISGVYIVNFY
jgi:hypothetical protein